MLGKRERPIFQEKSTTLWLASETDRNMTGRGLRPFGWTVLEPLIPELNIQLRAEEKDFTYHEMLAEKERWDKNTARLDREVQEKREAERLRRETEEVEQRERERQATIEAMSPEERLLVKFKDGSIRDEEVNIACKKIDEFPEDLKPALAARLKAYWIANKKWSKGEVGKKKWKDVRERNQKIDGLIGEQEK